MTSKSARPALAQPNAGTQGWLVAGGEMGKVIRAMDWASTPLGPIEAWPASLRTTVGLCLASNFPISLAWGPKHIQIYNDGYWPICGGKHPGSMGQDFSECWASAWPVIGAAFARALAGETSYLEDQRMFLDRNGYLEETFFTFSFSPIRDETGSVAGLFHPVTETTAKMLNQRRTRTLRDLAARTGLAQTSAEAFAGAAQALSEAELDIPFALFYLVTPLAARAPEGALRPDAREQSEAKEASLLAHTGLGAGTFASPARVELGDAEHAVWPFAQVFEANRALELTDLARRFTGLSCGPYPEQLQRALLLPITPPGWEKPAGLLALGVSSRLPFDDVYRAFLDLVGAGVTTALANALAYEEARKRAEALAEIDRAKTAFFSNISHEFRTPLTLMLGPLEDELAEPEGLPRARRERLEVAHRNTLRLLKLVNTLLDFSRIEAGRTQASFEPTDLAALTAELASVFRSAIEKAELTFRVDCPPLPQPIYIDREMWEKVVLNLLSNALKHTFTGGIEVTLRWLGERAKLTVRDSGVGIPEAELPRIFERFHRVRGAKSRTHEGTGIGLALVKELVGIHGGSVQVESHEGSGTTFYIELLAGSAHLAAERVGAARTLASTGTSAMAYVEEALHWLPDRAAEEGSAPEVARRAPASEPGPRPRILWADDNLDMREYVSRLLAERYDVLAVPDGKAALAAALENPPDLVLSDVMMPLLDGVGLLAELRAHVRTRTIPVILLSARAGEEAALVGLDAGADDYLAKPFSARELLARVRTHLDLSRVRRQGAAELARANKELEAFSYAVSHDLRAPLRAIEGFSAALLEDYSDRLDGEGRSYLQRVRAATARMAALIDALLNLSRLSRGPLRRELVDVTALSQRVLDDLRRREPERSVITRVQSGLSASADPALLAVVLDNLLGNAWKFSAGRDPAQIEVGSVAGASAPTFFVRDDGAGFELEFATKLFQPFQRLHTQSRFAGTGIGLATVHRVVSRHGGRVWADAAAERGATFFFTLSEES
jgi:signal transduction histidine kinase